MVPVLLAGVFSRYTPFLGRSTLLWAPTRQATLIVLVGWVAGAAVFVMVVAVWNRHWWLSGAAWLLAVAATGVMRWWSGVASPFEYLAELTDGLVGALLGVAAALVTGPVALSWMRRKTLGWAVALGVVAAVALVPAGYFLAGVEISLWA